MAHWIQISVIVSIMILCVLGKPVRRGEPPPPPPPPHGQEGGSPDNGGMPEETGLAYDLYLRQVVEVLESDLNFRKKLETANISEIKSGNIAMHLEMVNHTVRSALDELKRQEVARLQDLARLQMQAREHNGVNRMEVPHHLDLKNPHSFEMADLKKLIIKTTSDLEELDKKRKEEFKEYEMEKEYEKQQHLSELSEEERKKEEARLEELKKKHANHPKINHPGSKDQFEEVWDKVDHLEEQAFNPKTFFFQHDLNGDLEWNIEEVDAVLQLELDKAYDAKNPREEDDPIEREEEMNRMRAHVFEEIDKNKDMRISLKEFLEYTQRQGPQAEFEKNEEWKTLDEQKAFSDDDYKKFLEEEHPKSAGSQPQHDLKFEPEHPQQQQQQQPLAGSQHEPQHQPDLHGQQQQHPQGQVQQPLHHEQQQQHEGQHQQAAHYEQINNQDIQEQIKALQDKLKTQDQSKQHP